MPLLTRTVNAPLVIEISRGAVQRVGDILETARVHGAAAVVVGTGLGERVTPVVKEAIPDLVLETAATSTVDEARRIESVLRSRALDVVVAVGGGGTLDVTKWAASMVGLPFVGVATNLAHDGLASPVAVLEADGHKHSYGVHIPLAVVVDLDFVAQSPVSHTRAGIGDVISNISAVEDWLLAREAEGETVDGLAVTFARSAAEAVLRHDGGTGDEAFLHTLADSLVLSGIAMSVAGNSRPCSGACHEISHAIDALFPGTGRHGEQVAVGTLFALFLKESPALGAVNACFERHGLGRLPDDLGLSHEQFTEAVLEAPATRPNRYTVLEHLALTRDEARRRVDEFASALAP